MVWAEVLQSIGSLTTAAGVGCAAWQLLLTKRQGTTAFEDGMAKEYRAIAHKLPVKALLGDALSSEDYANALDEFYHYVDLSNEQVFLRMKGRVSQTAWDNWRDGIRGHLSQPAFREAWEHIKEKAPNSFHELRRLEGDGFNGDPRIWK